MGIWDKIKNMLGIAGNEGTADNNIDQTEQTEAPEESKSKESVGIEPTKEEGQEKPNIG